jgi:uncharacterized protein
VTAVEAVLLLSVGLVSGAVNAVAGGGSLLSFPALVALGLPPLPANVTNSVALWPGYVGTCAAYRSELAQQRRRLLQLLPAAVVGAVGGCLLLLLTDEDAFEQVVPWLVLLGALLLAVQGRIAERVRGRPVGERPSPWLHVGLLLVSAYGSYFGGGLGVLLLAVLGLTLADDLQRLNGLKAALSLTVNGVALVAFALFGPVEWDVVAVLAPAALLGGFLGGRLARRLPAERLRTVVVVLAVVAAIALL